MDKQDRAFAGKVAMITGGSRGIGYAAARAFLEVGGKVSICAVDEGRLKTAEKGLARLGEVLAVPADVRIFDRVAAFADQTLRRFGAIDILVNNAGALTVGDFAGLALGAIDEVIDINVKGVLYATRAVLPHMLARNSGVIINISSGLGKGGMAGVATYCTSKFAVLGFTESVAEEVARSGVRVYAICPGRVATDMQQQFSGQKIGMAPEHIAEKILQLAGPKPPVKVGEALEVYH